MDVIFHKFNETWGFWGVLSPSKSQDLWMSLKAKCPQMTRPCISLGVPADEIHVCGEAAAIDLVRELLLHSGEDLEVKTYNRLTKLVKETEALKTLENVQPGDCIVCFSKQDIYAVSRGLEKLGMVSFSIHIFQYGTVLSYFRFNFPVF